MTTIIPAALSPRQLDRHWAVVNLPLADGPPWCLHVGGKPGSRAMQMEIAFERRCQRIRHMR